MPKLRILDCTLRDGGLTNNFSFEDKYIQNHLQLMALAHVDFVEMGYKTSGSFYDKQAYGPLKFCPDSYIRQFINNIENPPALAFMVDVGKFDREDIAPASQSPFVMARVACYLNQIEQAVQDVLFFQENGYITTLNIMAISKEQPQEIRKKLQLVKQVIPFITVYIVDSYGALYPDQIRNLITLYKQELPKSKIGIHVHNNMQLAFSNTITAIEHGAVYADASVKGMGRGAGNCPLECLLPYVEKKFANKNRYDLKPVLKLINDYYQKEDNYKAWGFCTKQLLTGLFNQHPVYSLPDRSYDLADMYDYLQRKDRD